MSKQQSSTPAGNCDCGFDASNKLHHESYWEGRTDPRERYDDKAMNFPSNYYKVVDRQIAENHTSCGGAASQGSSSKSSKK